VPIFEALTYWGKVWDAAANRHRKTRRCQLIGEAKNLRDDLLAQVRQGTVKERPKPVFFEGAKDEFIKDCRVGVVLNKQGKPYARKAITNLESSLRRRPESLRRKRVEAITEADFQHAVDGFIREELSGSRIKSIVNAGRSFSAGLSLAGRRNDQPAGDDPAAGGGFGGARPGGDAGRIRLLAGPVGAARCAAVVRWPVTAPLGCGRSRSSNGRRSTSTTT
jgi:hypothetical protein